MELSQRSNHVFFFIALISTIAFVNSEIRTWYIFPSTNGAACPSTNKCIILSHITENNYTLKSGSDIILLFLPGNHTLTASVTIMNLCSITLMSNKSLPRPVINCEQSAQFHLLSSSYIRIDGFSLNGCLNNTVSMVDEIIIKDSKMLGNRSFKEKVSVKALIVTGSTDIAVGNEFESFHNAIYLVKSSAYIANCSFMIGGALLVERCSNITIVHSTFTCYSNSTESRSCKGAVLLYF